MPLYFPHTFPGGSARCESRRDRDAEMRTEMERGTEMRRGRCCLPSADAFSECAIIFSNRKSDCMELQTAGPAL